MKANNDTKLQHYVLTELEWEPSIDASKIGVTAKEGVVTLTGFVSSYADMMTADRVVKRICGVKAVANDIKVRLLGYDERSDADIAAAAVSALKWNASVPSDAVQITVRDGVITLEGEVEWNYQKAAAERAVRILRGVKGVFNNVRLKVCVQSGDVQDKIEAAFKRSAEIDARRISVESHDGRVILNGSVRSWVEHDEAEQAAWAAPGVTAVENHLAVAP
jgi:osmotically-inducible protein OsmY